jgi:uncharacterized membrane protein YdfJ with MMPL/SSD domain
MADMRNQAQPALEKLLQSDPDQLYAELGLRQKAIQVDPQQAAMFETTATYDAAFAGPLDVLKDFGRKFFNRFSKDAYALVCGTDQQNSEERKKIVEAFGGGQVAVASALTAALMSWFGWAPAIAAVIAALIVKLFFKNAHTAMCDVWKQRLPQ